MSSLGTFSTGDPGPPRRPRRHQLSRRITALPLTLMSAVALTLGIASPVEAAPPTAKKFPKQKLPRTVAPTPVLASNSEAPTLYTVVEGDTVSGIAERFGLATASVLALNGLGWSSLIHPGQILALRTGPAPEALPTTPEIRRYTVVAGDTISGIAAAHGIDVDAVLSANGLHRSSLIFPGQAIVLPDDSARHVPPETPTHEPASGSSYTVVPDDTPIAIADALGVDVDALLERNGLDRQSTIYPGQKLEVPNVTAVAVTTTAVTTDLGVVPLDDEMRENAAIIISVGRALDISDEAIVIALAAAAQESGMRNVDYGDRDSLGLFQQRPSQGWGTEAEVRDPVHASMAFFGGATNPNPGRTQGILDIPGWESMSVHPGCTSGAAFGVPGPLRQVGNIRTSMACRTRLSIPSQ